MQIGVFTFGGVELSERGPGSPHPVDRRQGQKEMWSATEAILGLGMAADRIGYDSFWLTEHHFQYEGYEVTPNAVLLCTWLAAKTNRIRLGALFNIVPQWHPLRLAEDFATMHNLSGGRGILGVGRGTVPRELLPLSLFAVSVGSFDNPDRKADDDKNREVFAESLEVIKKALEQETFSHSGEYFQLPPPGIPDRGSTVQELTLIPRPLYPYEIWQAITSPPTLEAVPRLGHGGVFWLMHHDFVKRFWNRYGEIYQETHDRELAAGENRMLVVCVRVADTKEQAVDSARLGHDEFWRFLAPYGWSRGYMGDDGKPAVPGLTPTLEESMRQKVWLVGTAEEVAGEIAFYRENLGCDKLVIFPQFAGDSYALAEEQIERFWAEVVPLI